MVDGRTFLCSIAYAPLAYDDVVLEARMRVIAVRALQPQWEEEEAVHYQGSRNQGNGNNHHLETL